MFQIRFDARMFKIRFRTRAPQRSERSYGSFVLGSIRLYRLGVTMAQKAKESGDERPRLRASQRMSPTFLFLLTILLNRWEQMKALCRARSEQGGGADDLTSGLHT